MRTGGSESEKVLSRMSSAEREEGALRCCPSWGAEGEAADPGLHAEVGFAALDESHLNF
jgi:hypothetical protein